VTVDYASKEGRKGGDYASKREGMGDGSSKSNEQHKYKTIQA
jgi:hypothetical protein